MSRVKSRESRVKVESKKSRVKKSRIESKKVESIKVESKCRESTNGIRNEVNIYLTKYA